MTQFIPGIYNNFYHNILRYFWGITTATSINAATSTRIEIHASPRIETAPPEVATTSFDLCGY